MKPPVSLSLPDLNDRELAILPLEQSETIPSSWYTHPAFHDFDNAVVLSRSWQHIGPISKLMNAGDQLVAEVGGNPILGVRGNDGTLRAFYNVCRHRGGPLAIEDCNAKVLQCKYHGWTYLLDGRLRGTPRFDRTELFDKKDYGLVPVRVDSWHGLAFVNLGENGIPIGTLFQGIGDRIKPYSLEGKKFYKRIRYEVKSNWKIYVDNYLEGYHLPYVHPELCNLLDYRNYVTETFQYYSLQHSPIQKNENLYDSSEGPAYYFFVWPNFMMNILPGRLQTNIVLPVAHNRCHVTFDYYYGDLSSEKALIKAEDDIQYSDMIQQEDIEICERVQKGLESQAYHKGRFSPECENGVYHFQCLLKQAYTDARRI